MTRTPGWVSAPYFGPRFTVLETIGAGGMGIVYRVLDRERDAQVALKTIRDPSPNKVYRLKREFRGLSGVVHRNLVTLYDLVEFEGQWFFTMELLSGSSFFDYLLNGPEVDAQVRVPVHGDAELRGTRTLGVARDHTSSTAQIENAQNTRPVPHEIYPKESRHALDMPRIRAAFGQLAEGVHALHRSGHLHRDIKPSNVVGTHDGRIVLLDFGIIAELAARATDPLGDQAAGTIAYMSPEQIQRRELREASDWYAVGLMLFEALTGTRAFSGTVEQIQLEKIRREPPAARTLNPRLPEDLNELCARLLGRDADERPSGPEVLRWLGVEPPSPAFGRGPRAAPSDASFVGRDRELERLRTALASSMERPVRVAVSGTSGSGKTELITRFLTEVAGSDDLVVLRGRCHEREFVPYKGVDSLIDSLYTHLLALDAKDIAALVPRDTVALVRLFPVLKSIPGLVAVQSRMHPPTEPREIRQRGFLALRELVWRLAERRPMVLFVDDLQWGDQDSIPLFTSLLRAPAPPLLLIVAYREEDVGRNATLDALLADQDDPDRGHAEFVQLPVRPLRSAQALALSRSLLASSGGNLQRAESIARSSEGSPFFIQEMVHYSTLPGASTSQAIQLAHVLLARIEALSPSARSLLQVVSVAGKPLPQRTALRVAEIDEPPPRVLAELRANRMLRVERGRDADLLEAYHDRIRETVVGNLPTGLARRTHERIARELLDSGADDFESIALHLAAADEPVQARTYAIRAGDAAADALAFERAAGMYRLALELPPPPDRETAGMLWARLAESLVNAGHGRSGAQAYLEAAALTTDQQQVALQVRAGSELMRSGRPDEGLAVLRPSFHVLGMRLAHTVPGALFSLLVRRAYLRMRGVAFRERDPETIDANDLARIDTYSSAAGALGMIDWIRGADAQTRHLLSALEGGDLSRIGRALAYEAIYSSVGGPRGETRTRRLLRAVEDIQARTNDAHLAATLMMMRGGVSYQYGRWTACRQACERAELLYRTHCKGVDWEMSSVQLHLVWSLYWLGDFRELERRARAFTEEASERGNLYAVVSLGGGLPSFWGLVADDAAGTRRRINQAADAWSPTGFHLQHYWIRFGRAHCDLYDGEPVSAYRRATELWKVAGRTVLRTLPINRSEMLHLRARAALSACELGVANSARFLRIAARLARRLGREPLGWCRGAADLLRAGVAACRGDRDRALFLLDAAHVRLRATETNALAAAAQRRHGQLLGGEAGRQLCAEADAWFTERGTRNVARMSDLLAPGFSRYRAR